MLGVLGAVMPKLAGSGNYSLPLFHGTLSIILITITGLILIHRFNIKNHSNLFFLAGIMISIPSIACLFGFMFTAPYYLIGLLMGVTGGIFICDKSLTKNVIGVILIACATGTYQVYFATACCISLLCLIHDTYQNSQNWSVYFKTSGFVIIKLALGLVGYFLANKFFLYVKHTSLIDYINLTNYDISSVSVFLKRIPEAYVYFFLPHLDPAANMFPERTIYLYWFILIVMLFSIAFVLAQLEKKKMLQVLILIIQFPLAVNFIYVLAGEAYSLTAYNSVFTLFAVLIFPFEKLSSQVYKKIIYILMSVLLVLWVRFSNICYLKAEFMQNEAISYFTTLITRIESTPGYQHEMPVLYIGSEDKWVPSHYSQQKYPNITLTPYDYSNVINIQHWRKFVSNWCGYEPKETDSDSLKHSEEIQQMPLYPDDGSIKIIDGTIVIRFN